MPFEAKDLAVLHDRVVLEVPEQEEQTAGGIYIPEAAKEKSNIGIVVAVGDEVQHVAVGNKVLFAKYAGTDLKLNQHNVKIMPERDVLAIIQQD